MSVILDFYRGNLRPLEQICHPESKVYMDLVEDTKRFEVELMDGFTEKQRQLFETIRESTATLNSMEQEETFAFGFKLGIQFGTEIFKPDSEDC